MDDDFVEAALEQTDKLIDKHFDTVWDKGKEVKQKVRRRDKPRQRGGNEYSGSRGGNPRNLQGDYADGPPPPRDGRDSTLQGQDRDRSSRQDSGGTGRYEPKQRRDARPPGDRRYPASKSTERRSPKERLEDDGYASPPPRRGGSLDRRPPPRKPSSPRRSPIRAREFEDDYSRNRSPPRKQHSRDEGSRRGSSPNAIGDVDSPRAAREAPTRRPGEGRAPDQREVRSRDRRDAGDNRRRRYSSAERTAKYRSPPPARSSSLQSKREYEKRRSDRDQDLSRRSTRDADLSRRSTRDEDQSSLDTRRVPSARDRRDAGGRGSRDDDGRGSVRYLPERNRQDIDDRFRGR